MNELNEKDILRVMGGLRAVAPAAGESRRVMGVARGKLLRRRIMKWTMASGVAAAIVVGVVLGVMSWTGRTATPAEGVVQATQASRAYRGWVHMRSDYPGQKISMGTHFNTETGTWISDIRNGDEVQIQIYNPTDKSEVKYSSADKTVRIGEVWEDFAKNWKKMIEKSPLTATEGLAQTPGATVKETKEEGLVRYDITYPKDDPKKAAAEHRSGLPTEATIWADAQTKLVKKGKAKVEGEWEEFSYTYGEPAIRDVYDLGVARDSKVVDARPAKNVDELFRRLDKRFAEGFGDCVAVLTEQGVDQGGKAAESGGSMWLFAQRGKAFVANRYLVSDPVKPGEEKGVTRPYGKVPAGWPTPGLEAALASMKQVPPTSFLVSDGKSAWSGFEGSKPGVFRVGELNSDSGKQMLPTVLGQFSLQSHVWKTQVGMGAFGADAKVKLVRDEKRPGMVGLQVDQKYPGRDMKPTRMLNTYWMDPAKDDVPVERTQITFVELTEKEEIRFETKFEKYAQTEKGQWYPSEWTTVTTMHYQGTDVRHSKNRLQIWVGKTVGEEWFKKPEGKVEAE
jgi:hypothetical protein